MVLQSLERVGAPGWAKGGASVACNMVVQIHLQRTK